MQHIFEAYIYHKAFLFSGDPETTTENPGICSKPQWVNDGFCDDITNTIECNFDGGDCCGIYINTYYCDVCTCLEEEVDSTPTAGLH